LESYRNYLRLLARTAIDHTLRGKADPSDLIQETMLKAINNFGAFRGDSEPELAAWLRSILAQNLTDLARHYRTAKRSVQRELSLDELMERSSQTYNRLFASDGRSSSELTSPRDHGVVLAEALAQLSDEQREVIILRSLEQLPWDDVGRRVGRSADAARMVWARALKSLRGKIDERL
jgi:RNA polymerase sigma-70 factor (ECF subfamily)